MWLAFHLTDRCQLDCRHCTRDPEKKPRDLPVDLIERVLDQAKGRYRIGHVALTGGEPTLHPELSVVVDAIAHRGLDWHLVTNGVRFARFLAMIDETEMRRRSLAWVALSVDGADEATHDAIRGAGSYREAMSAASLCRIRGLPFRIKTTIHAANVSQIEAMGVAAAQLGADEIGFAMMRPTGSVHDRDLFLSASAWRGVAKRIERLAGTIRLRVTMAEGFPSTESFHVCEPFAGKQLHVDDRGRLNLCCEHSGQPNEGRDDEVAGDLAAMPLVDAHRRLLAIMHDAQTARLDAIADGSLSDWDSFACNACMKHFGKPHWSDAGAEGPEARRERWNGAWDRAHQSERGEHERRIRLRVVG